MSADWKLRVVLFERGESSPVWLNSIPNCSEDACRHYDGKRCRLTGFSPGAICEPVVDRMGDLLDEAAAGWKDR